MGIMKSFLNDLSQKLESFSEDFFYRKTIGENDNVPVKLLEPSEGEIVELKLTEQNEITATLYMAQLEQYAKYLEKLGVQTEIRSKSIIFTCPTDEIAEEIREVWRE